MKLKKSTWWIVSSIAVALIVGIVIGNFISVKSLGRKLFLSPSNKIDVLLDIINEDYVDAVNMKDISEGAIRNIISELDPHSMYIPSSEVQNVNDDMDGHFGGIGVNHFIYDDTLVVINVVHGGPASQAGLMPGDRIVTVNDSLFTGPDMSEKKIINTFRGAIGSIVKLGIRRNGYEKLIEYKIKRNEILIPTVKAAYQVADGIGLIKIFDKFSQTTHDEFVQAMTKLVSLGCKSFIIDLRDNSGGSYEAAIKIINEFFSAGKLIVYAEGKSFPRIQSVSDGTGNLANSPVVILMNQMSASASEIVAGAIQDNDRGLIVGRRSFGKGLVQNQIALSDGSAVRLTIARYYTPSGRNIQRKYELGKSMEYNRDWLNQFNSGENFYKDSIKIDTTAVFKTVHGRTVYGNGGIMPDIFVPFDTAHLSSYYINLEEKNIFNRLAFEYAEENREELNQFKDYPAMLHYLQTHLYLWDIIEYAEYYGVKKRTLQINRSAQQIQNTAYAHIINTFFGEDAFFQVYMRNDPVIVRAVQAIQKGEAAPQAIAAMKYKK